MRSGRRSPPLSHRTADAAACFTPLEALSSDPGGVTHDRLGLAGTRRAFERHSQPVRGVTGEPVGRVVVLREISGDREAEALQSEITEKREAVRANSELVATVSHELRTPLTAVLGFAELLLHHDLDEDTSRRYLQTIVGEAQRLTALIDDFLDLERLEAGRFTLALESFDMTGLVEHEVALFSAQSAQHQLAFASADHPLVLVGDRNRIGQVIANLLSNAIKYSPAGGAVTITATSSPGFTRVCVNDCGLGIPAAQQAQVFTKFFRVDSSDTREIGGTGLGLALCHEIVTAHGGRIGFESADRDPPQFVVHERDQLVEGGLISFPPCEEKSGDLVRGWECPNATLFRRVPFIATMREWPSTNAPSSRKNRKPDPDGISAPSAGGRANTAFDGCGARRRTGCRPGPTMATGPSSQSCATTCSASTTRSRARPAARNSRSRRNTP